MDAASAEELKEGKHAEKMKFLKKCVDFYKAYKHVFLYGRLCEIPKYSCENHQIIWTACGMDETLFDYADNIPVINATVWETVEGARVLFAYNYSDTDQKTEICGREIEVPAKSFFKLDI